MEIEKCNCYYEILNVEINATIEEIKKSYKKIILQYHPDKNAHLSEEQQKKYTNIFRKIQEAYECLTDEKRRKWYDKNRKRIIEGREDEEKNELNKYSSKHINIWEYFNNNCYSGFDDSEKGFYNVYKNLFDEIIKEENEEIQKKYKNNKEKINAPSFGNSKSSGKDIDAFYEFWSNFTTVKKFDYSYDYIKSCEFENRNVRRTLKKVNEKRSLKERKEYNENIRSLVHHLKKYDVRYLNRIVEIAEEKRKKIEEREKQKKLQMLQRKILFEQSKKREYSENGEESDNYSLNHLDKDFSDSTNYSSKMRANKKYTKETEEGKHIEKDDEDDKKIYEEENSFNEEGKSKYYEHTYNIGINDNVHNNDTDKNNVLKKIIYRCEVCKKNFKSMNQYESHEKSKKHVSNFLKNSKKYDLRSIFEEEENQKKEVYSDNKVENMDNIDNKKKEFSLSQFKNIEKINNDIYEKVDNSSDLLNVNNKKLQLNENLTNEEILEDYDKLFQDKNTMCDYKNKNNKSVKKTIDTLTCENEKKEEKKEYEEKKKNEKSSLKKNKNKDKCGKENISCNIQNDVTSESSNNNENLLSWYRSTKKNKTKFLQIESSLEDNDYFQNNQNMNNSNDDNDTSGKKKKTLKKNKKKALIKNENKTNNIFEENSDWKPKVNHTNKIKENIKNNQCKICKQTFDSRNKLFHHIEIKGHAAYKNK
ncbi:DnaJ protein, putative [Plasmodium gallinaceum]|uniref:DnaJ protein, putative n=1 Tax=Plasmodium gallinaceum TaxID=5849 RepID=A0A1J1GNT0_PLAGA|nr:DnaJ protein, putative [Plasmodium gallinaceum]CRG94114.1 DnaJ protein, putative [Plasmodium gallinaceum]